MSEVKTRNSAVNRNGIRIMAAYVPAEQFYVVYDGPADTWSGLKFRRATVPSRLKYTD